MRIKDAYETLVLVEKCERDISHGLAYFQDRGLVHSASANNHHELVDLLGQRGDMFEELERLHWQNLHLSSDVNNRRPLTYLEGSKWNEYLELSAKARSRWHRFKSSKRTLDEERKRFEALSYEVDTASERAKSELKKIQEPFTAMRTHYEGLTKRINEILDDSEAWRAWAIRRPWKEHGEHLEWVYLTSKRCSENDYRGCVRGVSKSMLEALKTYFQLNDGNYTTISGNGSLVAKGIEQAGLKAETEFDFDAALDLVEMIMVRHLYSGIQNPDPINWDSINVEKSLCRIKELKSKGRSVKIDFSPAYTEQFFAEDPYYYGPTSETYHEQTFAIVERQ
ncbi:hypothetical protein HYU11_05385 [Candidatus Woesearchaeota archaeon]|nr:hypothetical protein [Candidatus Woesearchaeota archaeon]